jgi:cell division transport system permease protein
MLRSIGFLFREFLDGLGQNRLAHFTYGTQVTISLLVLGIFFVMLIGSAVFWSRLGSRLEVHVFLNNNLTQAVNDSIESQLRAIEHVSDVTYRTKEEALDKFRERYSGMSLDDLVRNNPLPASFVVKVDSPRNIESVANAGKQITGVYDVGYAGDLLGRYLKVMSILMLVCAVTMIVLVIFSYTSISNIIRVSIDARSREIRIMQLVGATWWFIRWPFLFEGVFIGLIGSTIALCVVWALLAALAGALQASDLPMQVPWLKISEWQMFAWLGVVLIGLGLVVGFFGSLRAVNAYLHREVEVTLDAQKIRQLTRG